MERDSQVIKKPWLFLEKYCPYITGGLSVIVWLLLDCIYPDKINFPDKINIISGTLIVSGILVGFLATSKAILISMDSSSIMDSIRESGYINELVNYIGEAIRFNLIFCVVSVFGYFIDRTAYDWYPLIWIFFAVGSLSAFIRMKRIMLKLFKANNPNRNK